MVARAHEAGFPVAIHAVEAECVAAAARAIAEARERRPIPFADRIEHCSECPPGALALVRESGAAVVTQPAFVYYNGPRYLSDVPKDTLPWLYAMRSLLDAGVPVAAGSDAPVAGPDPLVGIAAAVTRESSDGRPVAPAQAVTPIDALRAYTAWAARATGQQRVKGVIAPRPAGRLRPAVRRPHGHRATRDTPRHRAGVQQGLLILLSTLMAEHQKSLPP